ncbi:restriction endonuclease subunit S [Selenomonas ruminantium]|uniref:Type I restriction enzyme, S subunit n=1 Tax=Selenomonas ruminantium TaxID=971 RepID=A0A1I0W5Z4_SELRU|nr:restriction endonuclease subunit S [Selenomonas ruminantium]SFA84082.1 type I restriction enzyme, S subunit [Selenomonas ruminantium]
MAKKQLTTEEKLQAALVLEEEQPYKVPENWCWVRLGAITSIVGGGTPSSKVKEYYEDGTIPWLSPADLSGYEKIYISRGAKNITELGLEKSSAKLMPKDTVLLSSRAPIGYVAIAENEMCTNQGFKSFLPSPAYTPRYLYWYLRGAKNLLESYASGTTFLELSASKVAKVEFPLAPIEEQSRIVARIESLFAKLDEAKGKIQEVLDGAELRKAAILHQAFTGKLTEKWRKENNISDDWQYKYLYQTDIDIIDGDRGKNYPKKEEFCNNGYCVFLNAKNVTKDGFCFEDVQFISKEKDDILRKGKLVKGDVVLTTRGTVGNIALYDSSVPYENLRINSGMVIYRGGEDFFKPFLINLYKSSYIHNQIEKLKTGSAQPQLPIKVMRNLKLCIPTILEQQEIVRLLDNLLSNEQSTITACESALDTIDTLKKSILARAFRGELGTNDPSEASAKELLQEILAG